jgi:hypothetical protein
MRRDKRVGNTKRIANWLKTHYQDVIAVIFIIIFTISGIATLKEYGINWDEGLGNIFFGERNLYYFRTFDAQYLNFSAQISNLDSLPINASLSPWHVTPQAFPPLFDTISAGSMHFFAYTLNWLDPIDGFHLPTILFSALFLVFLYLFFSKRLGKTVSLLGIIMIGTFPRFFGDMHFNEKDIPEVVAFGLAVISYYWWYESKTWKRAVLAGIIAGIAWAIKVNALFLPFFFFLGVWKWNFKGLRLKQVWFTIRTFLWQHLIMIISAILVFFLSWPWLWADPKRFFTYFNLFLSQGQRIGAPEFSTAPLLLTLYTMPEFFLVFLILGIGLSIWWMIKEKKPIIRLLAIWLIIPIFRISIPGAVNFDGIRHFLEFLPAAAMLAAFGVVTEIQSFKWREKWLKTLVIIVLVVISILNIVEFELAYHPYEYLYYNHLIGSGEQIPKVFGDDQFTDYWGITYRKGMAWLKNYADPNSYVYVPVADHLTKLTQKIWLRPDIQLIDRHEIDEIRKTDAQIYVMFINRTFFYDDIAKLCINNGKPIFEINLKGISLMQIYRFDELNK